MEIAGAGTFKNPSSNAQRTHAVYSAQSDQNETDSEPNGDTDHTDDVTSQDEDTERTQFTQWCPPSVLEDVERVQNEYGLPSRNATINFKLKQAAKETFRQ